MTSPAPGVYRNIPNQEYVEWDALSKSGMVELDKSPLHYRTYIMSTGERKETKATEVGTLAHTAILEPERLAEDYRVSGQCEGVTQAGKQCENNAALWIGSKGLCGKHLKQAEPGAPRMPVKLVTQADMDAAKGMRDSFHAHPLCARLLRLTPPENRELSLVWIDKETGALCKARIDGYAADIAAEWDIKGRMLDGAETESFSDCVYYSHYHWQRAHNMDGLAAHGMLCERSYHVAIERELPHVANVFPMPENWLSAAMNNVRRLRKLYAECSIKNEWPGPDTGLREMKPKVWVQRQIDEQATNEIMEKA